MNTPITMIDRKSAQHQSVRDVIISGAGPVGLFLACELALAKCSVLLLEQAEDPHSPLKPLPFGIRELSAPSVEGLYRRGLLNELELHKRIKNPHQNAGQGSLRAHPEEGPARDAADRFGYRVLFLRSLPLQRN
jgi:2-polyprenyl-6-methoxyphenol hydroxylase-like FAD-dependent oxidoreductase